MNKISMLKRICTFIMLSLAVSFFFSVNSYASEVQDVKDKRTGLSTQLSSDAIIVTTDKISDKQTFADCDINVKDIQNRMQDSNIALQAIYSDCDLVVYGFKNGMKNSEIKSISINDYKKEFIKQIGDEYEIVDCYDDETDNTRYIYTKFINKTSGKEYAHFYTAGGGYGYSGYIIPTGQSVPFLMLIEVDRFMRYANLSGSRIVGRIIKLIVWLLILGVAGFFAYKKREVIKPYLSKEGMKKLANKENLAKASDKIKDTIGEERMEKVKSVVNKENLEKTKDSITSKIKKNAKKDDNVIIDDQKVIFGAVSNSKQDDATEIVLPNDGATEVLINGNNADGTIIESVAPDMDATVLQSDATVVEEANTVLETDATVVENDKTVLEADATVLENDKTILENNATAIENDVTKIE